MDRAQPQVIEAAAATVASLGHPVSARLHGFDHFESPVLRELVGARGELVAARSTVALSHHDIGREALVLFMNGDLRKPVIVGLFEEPSPRTVPGEAIASATVQASADGRLCVVEAEREVVLRCGAASITLTRAGKVIIEGSYVVSRSSGYNKLKGAAIDIN